mgnify:CR=1 FL=1
MVGNPLFNQLFGRSPITPIQKHMNVAYETVGKLGPYFEAVNGGDWEEAERLYDLILELESKADDLKSHIRYQHYISSANWSNKDQCWTLEGVRKDTGDTVRFTANFLWMCQGYYRHEKGYTPEWEGMADFKGSIIHPQTWPQDLDYTDKKVVVIGSGATAATLIPSMADKCSHITMLQRSPTYFMASENRNELADQLRELDVPETWVHEIVRRSLLKQSRDIISLSKYKPEILKEELRF